MSTPQPPPPAPATGIVGVVNGGVSVDWVPVEHWGLRVLTAVAGLATVALLAGAVTGRLSAASVVWGLLPPVAIIVLLAAVHGPRRDTGGRAGPRPWRARAAPAGAAPPAPGSGSTLTVRRFRVQTLTGDTVACVMAGELSGTEIRPGDIVRLSGRRARQGHFAVRRVTLLSSPTGPDMGQVSARVPARLLAARWGSRLCLVLAAFTGLWVAYAMVRGR